MNRRASIFKIFGRMTASGFILGGIAGGLVLLTLAFTHVLTADTVYLTLGVIFGGIIWSLIWGAMFGFMFGGISGFFSGLIMAIISVIGFREIRRPQFYKFSMGLITLVTTGYILFEFWGFLFELFKDNVMMWASALGMSVVIVIYASQITARKYINEMSVRKGKAKV